MPETQEQPQKTHKEISTTTWGLMIGVAIFFDVLKILVNFLDILPGLGTILDMLIGFFAFATFWLWFEMMGAKYSRKTMLFGFAIDFIPFIGDLAETGTIVRLYIKYKAEAALAKVPGGQLAGKALENKNALKKQREIDGLVKPLNPQPIRQSIRQPTRESPDQNNPPKNNRIKEWEEATNRLNEQQNKTLINKTYTGGIEKFNADGEKYADEWAQVKPATQPFRNTQGNIVTGETFQQRRKRMQIENREATQKDRAA